MFVKEGEQLNKRPKNCSVGLLSTTLDWVMTVDLAMPQKISSHIIQSLLKPVEVGSLGFKSHSPRTLGIKGARRRAINDNVEVAEKVSRWLWLKRADQWGH